MSVHKVESAVKLQGRIERLFQDLHDRGYEEGIQAVVYLKGECIVDVCVGRVSSLSNQPVLPDSLFPVCSTGKGISATVLHVLAARGQLDYDSPVARYWPDFALAGKADISVRQALSHQAGIPVLPAFSSFDEIWDWPRACARIAELNPQWEPGSKSAYHSITWGWLAGRIAEGAGGKPFSQLLRELVTQPLGIESLIYFGTDDEAEHRVSCFEAQPVEQEQCMTAPAVHDPNVMKQIPGPLMEFVNKPGTRQSCIPSVNGMMSARGIAKVYASLLGEVDGVRLLPDETLNAATTLQTKPGDLSDCFGHGMGLGYVLKGTADNPGSFFGHGGAGGSEGMANRALGMAFGLVKNRMDTHKNAPGHTLRLFLREFFNTLGRDGDGGFYEKLSN